MKVSEFQYTNPHLTEMVFMENPNFVMNKEKIEITENTTVKIFIPKVCFFLGCFSLGLTFAITAAPPSF